MLVVGGLLVGGSVAIDLLTVRSSLNDARAAVADLQGAVGDVDLDTARVAVTRAVEEIGEAERRTTRHTWTVTAAVPVIGPTVATTREVVEVAAAAIEVADIAVRDGGTLLTDGLSLAVRDGQLDLAPIELAAELVPQLPTARLTAARDALAEPRDAWVPEEILAGRADTLTLADQTVDALTTVEALSAALPPFLGADGPRRYFVAMQTSAELRGTGGLIGFWGVLSVEDGRINFGQGESFDPFDAATPPAGEASATRISSLGISSENPPGTDPAFLGRYATTAAARSFLTVNLDPDVPTAANAILDLYELQRGERLDGVILLDPIALEGLLAATGDELDVPAEVDDLLGLDGDTFPTADFARYVTADIYEEFGFDRSADRKELLRLIGDASFLRVVSGDWDPEAMVAAITQITRERHLQVFAADPEVQAAFDAVDATGSLHVDDRVDRFAVVANNSVGGKQDVHLGHGFRFDIDLELVRRLDDGALSVERSAVLEATIDNPLPTSGMDTYVIGSCYVPGERAQCFEGDPGTNRTWFSIWSGPQNSVRWFRSDTGGTPDSFRKTFRGLRVVDHFHLTPSGTTSTFETRLTGPSYLERRDDAVVYSFEWWRQSKGVPDALDISVTAPGGWAIGQVDVIGGGSGQGFGPDGEGRELMAEVVDGVARVTGTVTADTRVEVHLVAPETVGEQQQAGPGR
ncbi:MAG: DUF4012 domain-containing protein [Nitriliruptoraceae bacterium]|nr:DUF4012 domain-containing protein [Nitriliruptoraceae bacterium]